LHSFDVVFASPMVPDTVVSGCADVFAGVIIAEATPLES
jgi:hypothetical protein